MNNLRRICSSYDKVFTATELVSAVYSEVGAKEDLRGSIVQSVGDENLIIIAKAARTVLATLPEGIDAIQSGSINPHISAWSTFENAPSVPVTFIEKLATLDRAQ